MKIVTILWTNLVIILVLGFVFSVEIGTGAMKRNKKLRNEITQTEDEKINAQRDLPDMPIYYQGWIKYLHYTEMDAKKPKAFYKNTEYDLQVKRGISPKELEQTDKNGFVNIPNELYFYSVLYKDTLNIFSSRKDSLSNAVDSLDVNHISPIPELNQYQGGVTDFGKFDEGYCFKVKSKIPADVFTPTMEKPEPDRGLMQTWVICLDKEGDKSQMMNTIVKLKMKIQHDKGIYLEEVNGRRQQQGTQSSIHNLQNVLEKSGEAKRNSTLDGHWILLQDWTQCTLKCGGGLQYQQLMCVPPKTGGKPCQGLSVRTRPCNSQPCPSAKAVSRVLHPVDTDGKPENHTLAPIVKIMSVSQRPQKYDKCYIKESDAMMEKDDATTASMKIKPKIPVRIVMNDKTISAYLDDNLVNNVITFNIQDTVFVRIPNEKKCFRLKTNSKNALFCQLDSQAGDYLDEWDYDFNLFKNQCKTERVRSNIILKENKKLQEDFKIKVQEVKNKMVLDIADKNKIKVGKNEEKRLNQKVQQVQTTSILAIQKESKLEELLEKEEIAQEDNETKSLELEIQVEKNKAECLQKVIKEKEIENQMNIAKAHAEDQIRIIQENTKKEVARKRLEIKRKIMEMRKKQERKKASLKNEIMVIRTTLANKMTKLSKRGNEALCSNTSTESQRVNYCAGNFADNYIKYQDCLNDTQYCYVCCENEFGDFHIADRDKCYAKCDSTKTNIE